MNRILTDGHVCGCHQLYYGVIYNSILHFGWVDYIDGYHKVVKKSPYSVYGIIAFLKDENKDKNLGLECLVNLYKSCHAYTHGSIQTARYLVLHYFEITIMFYWVICKGNYSNCPSRIFRLKVAIPECGLI